MAGKLMESAKRWAARHVIILTGQDGSGQVVKEADDEINALIHAWRGLGVRVSFLDWEDESAEHRCCEAMAVLPLQAWREAIANAHQNSRISSRKFPMAAPNR